MKFTTPPPDQLVWPLSPETSLMAGWTPAQRAEFNAMCDHIKEKIREYGEAAGISRGEFEGMFRRSQREAFERAARKRRARMFVVIDEERTGEGPTRAERDWQFERAMTALRRVLSEVEAGARGSFGA